MSGPEPQPKPQRQLAIVTGMSGAGRTSSLKALEDIGFEAIDNLPIPMIERFIRLEDGLERDLAIGLDSRTRDFDPKRLARLVERLASANPSVAVSLLYLDCDDEILQQRFTETRRRHPLAADRPVQDGVAAERALLKPLKAAATLVVDTTQLALADLKRLLAGHFAASDQGTRPDHQLRFFRLSSRPAARGGSGLRRPLLAQPALRSRAAAADRARSGGAGAYPRRSRLRCLRGCAAGAARAAAAALPGRRQELPHHRVWLQRRPAPLRFPRRAVGRHFAGGRIRGKHGPSRAGVTTLRRRQQTALGTGAAPAGAAARGDGETTPAATGAPGGVERRRVDRDGKAARKQ